MILTFALTVSGYILDRLSKYIILKSLSAGESIPVLENIFHITFVNNTGAAFGILKGQGWLFIIIAVLSGIFLTAYLIIKRDTIPLYEKTALSLILAGILGNLTDRLYFGYVIDFLDFRVWPVFNIADSFITVGVAILLVGMLIVEGKGKSRIEDKG
jgi:signal peptidase II